jgi:hypothetical protein
MPFKSPNPIRPWMVASQKKKDPNARWANEAQGGVPNQFYRNAPWRKLRERRLNTIAATVSKRESLHQLR